MNDQSALVSQHTVKTSRTGCIDDTTELLFPEVGPGGFRYRIRALEMDCLDGVPFLWGIRSGQHFRRSHRRGLGGVDGALFSPCRTCS